MLVLVGAVTLGAYLAALAHAKLARAYDNWVFDQSLRGEPASLVELGQSLIQGPGSLIGRLEIPAVGVSTILREGTDPWTLNSAVGHIESTVLPWEAGNVGIAGHRDGVFRGLKDIARNDTITLVTLRGTYSYRVDAIQVVKPDEDRVLRNQSRPTLTLVTCYPFYFIGNAPKRFIVTARLVDPPDRHNR